MNDRQHGAFDLHPALRQSLFIAGTDTGVGKTWVATRLIRAWVVDGYRAAGMKPVAAGGVMTPEGLRNEDALALLSAGNVNLAYNIVNPVCLRRPTSPHLAAHEEGAQVRIESVIDGFGKIASAAELIAVEGAGGWWAPIGYPECTGRRGPTMENIAVVLGLPVLLVVGIRLGCLNHALLTVDAIERTGLKLAAWLANPIDPDFVDQDAYVESLRERLPAPRVVVAG